MNKIRRHMIQKAVDILEHALEQEQEYLDNMPESLQESERAETSQEWIDALEGAIDSLGSVE